MSWATHDIEPYLIKLHLGGAEGKLGWRVSFVAVLIGSWGPDVLTKWFIYGISVFGFAIKAGDPAEAHRSWPGLGFTHSLAFGVAGYYKPATVLVALREVLGRSTFEKAMQEYGRRWMNKHPTPFDFFNTIEDVSGRDLDWFWKTWFYETWQLDQAIAGVVTEGDSTRITVVNREKALMPVILAVGREGGKADTLTVPVEQWFGDRKEVTVTVPATQLD